MSRWWKGATTPAFLLGGHWTGATAEMRMRTWWPSRRRKSRGPRRGAERMIAGTGAAGSGCTLRELLDDLEVLVEDGDEGDDDLSGGVPQHGGDEEDEEEDEEFAI
jgi:hypothetical protein